jgi:hypothetical protein
MSARTPTWLPDEYLPAQGSPSADFVSRDGRRVLDLKLSAQGTRDLHGALMHLALILAEHRSLEQACLVVRFPRMTVGRAREAWNRARAVLHPEIADRLAIVVLARGGESWHDPRAPRVEEIARAMAAHAGIPGQSKVTARPVPSGSAKFFEVWKVLLEAWLRRRGPLSIHELMERVGCSYPTAMLALDHLEQRGELRRAEHRRIELHGFPQRTFEEGVVLGETLRRTQWFVDVSGRAGDPLALLRRLRRARPQAVAVGGVVAARRLDPDFDLHGTPRLDLTYWVPDGAPYDLGFVCNADPGMRLSPSGHDAVLAVHRLSRANDLFDRPEREPLPFADPVEVLLDLHELHMHAQAEILVRRVRSEVHRE